MNLEVFKEKKVWLFDLDNTIYSPNTKIFDQIDQRMKLFISKNSQFLKMMHLFFKKSFIISMGQLFMV